MKLSSVEKLVFPVFLFIFEIVFLILYGLLVRYDDAGSPHTDLTAAQENIDSGDTAEENVRNLQSTIDTTKIYPCE